MSKEEIIDSIKDNQVFNCECECHKCEPCNCEVVDESTIFTIKHKGIEYYLQCDCNNECMKCVKEGHAVCFLNTYHELHGVKKR